MSGVEWLLMMLYVLVRKSMAVGSKCLILMLSGPVELLLIVYFSAVMVWTLLISMLVVCSFVIFQAISLLLDLVVRRMMLVNYFIKLLAIFLSDFGSTL